MLANKTMVKIEINNLNVRKNPNMNAEVVETCVPGIYEMLAKKDGFVKIGKDKWVKTDYVELVELEPEPVKPIKKKESIDIPSTEDVVE